MGRTKSKAKKRAKKIKEKNLLNEQRIKEIGAKKGENKKEKQMFLFLSLVTE